MRWLHSYFGDGMENLTCLTFLLEVGAATHTSREYENYCLHNWALWGGQGRPPKEVHNGLERAGKGDSLGVYCDQGVGRVHVSDSGRCLCVWTFPWVPKEGVPGFPRSGKRESLDIWLTKMCSISFNWFWTCLVRQDVALQGLQPEASKRKVKVPSNTLFKSLVCSEKPNTCLFHSQKWVKLQKWTGTVFGEVTYCGYRKCGNMRELDFYSGWLWHKRSRIVGSLFVFYLRRDNIEQGPDSQAMAQRVKVYKWDDFLKFV